VPRRRADLVLVARRFFATRAKAQEAIAAGLVHVGEKRLTRASDQIEDNAQIRAAAAYPWVSRGGVKLAAALDLFSIDPTGAVCLDVGASTGGFADVLLTRGAARVYAADVGHGQLHQKLRGDPRLIDLSGVDARSLTRAIVPEPPSLIVSDVSFISLKLALPRPLALAEPEARLVALVKPQFEAGPARVKKGIVRDPEVHRAVCDDIALFLTRSGWRVAGLAPSPIAGGDGNREFLLLACGPAAERPGNASAV
jgi:23S rRNA (cytidine1920-2'-O)/16S rRNA (cytidine1409-2'-O)-methyltransferase